MKNDIQVSDSKTGTDSEDSAEASRLGFYDEGDRIREEAEASTDQRPESANPTQIKS